MVDKPIDMSLVYKRKNTLKTTHIERPLAEYSTVIKSINSNLRTNIPLTESYISACNDHDYANDNYDKCINILEAVKESNNQSQYTKLENIFINNVLPHIEDLDSVKYRVQESGSIEEYNINSIVEEYKIADRILGNYNKIDNKNTIDYIFRENTNIMDKCYEISDIVNKYDISLNNKVSIALETCLYGLYKNGIDHNRSEVLEHVTEYFLSVNNTLSDLDMSKLQKTITDTKLVSSLDCKELSFLKEEYNYYSILLEQMNINTNDVDSKKIISDMKKVKSKKEANTLIARLAKIIINAYIISVTIPFVTVTILINALLAVSYVIGIAPALLLNKLISEIDKSAIKFNKEQKVRYNQVIDFIKNKSNTVSVKESYENDFLEYIENDKLIVFESEDYADSQDVKKAIAKYKADQCKDLSKFKRIITKFYAKSPDQVIDELPNILAWIRLGFVFSTAAFNPIITVPIFIVDQFIAMGFKRKEAERMVKIFTKERDKAESKSYTVSNSEKIDKYVKCLNTCLYKLEDYRDKLYSEKELEKRDELYECATSFDYQISLDEVNINSIKSNIRKLESSTRGTYSIDIKEDVYRFYEDSSIYEYINENGQLDIPFCSVYKDYDNACLYADRLSSIYENYIAIVEPTKYAYDIHIVEKHHIQLNEAEQDKYDNCIPYEMRKQLDTVATISGNIDYLNTLNPMGINKEIKENFDILMGCPELTCRYVRNSKNIVDVKEFYRLLENYQDNLSEDDFMKNTEINFAKPLLFKESLGIDPATDILLEAQSIQGLRNIINEGVSTANIKTACLNMKKKIVNLSAKEQQLSKNLDASANVFSKNVQKALTTNRREAIIKGSVIPSFSKIIKMSLVAGATYLVSPTIAVIGTIGALGCSKILTNRERKALLDEIDIELTVVEKEIAKADREDNMKEYRHLLTYQRKLEREKMRIKYSLGPHKQVPGTTLAHLDRDDD